MDAYPPAVVSLRSVYHMTRASTDEGRTWHSVRPGGKITAGVHLVGSVVLTGDHFGMVALCFGCPCCDKTFGIHGFFHIDGDGRCSGGLCERTAASVAVVLPDGILAAFERFKSNPNRDGAVMFELARACPSASQRDVYKTLHARILLRSAFAKLFYRCFRKAFAPTARQGRRLIHSFEAIYPVLDDDMSDSHPRAAV